MKRTLTSAVKEKPTRQAGCRKLKAPTKAELVSFIVSLGFIGKTPKQLARMTIAQLQSLIATLNPITPTIDVVADAYVEQTVDTSCAASVIATSEPPLATLAEPLPLPVAQFAPPLPVARIAPPIVKESRWSIFGKCVASVLAAPFVIASLPIIAGIAIGAVIVAHVANEI